MISAIDDFGMCSVGDDVIHSQILPLSSIPRTDLSFAASSVTKIAIYSVKKKGDVVRIEFRRSCATRARVDWFTEAPI